jgi:Archaeal/vacuolar-type H+-ATPase subunit C
MSDLFYLSARLRAMRAQFLSRREYETILALPDLSSIAWALRESPYGHHIESTGGEVPEAARIEEALRRNVSQTLTRLLAISSGDCAEAVRLVLGRWEVQAVKTVLRGIVSGASPAEILSSLVPTGLHDEAALEEMCRQADPRALAELMVTWREPWGRPLLRALPEYREPRDLAILESALDRCWFEQAAKRLREIRPSSPGEDALSLFVSLSVDTTNLMTVLKEVEDRIVPVNPDRYLLPGGRIFDGTPSTGSGRRRRSRKRSRKPECPSSAGPSRSCRRPPRESPFWPSSNGRWTASSSGRRGVSRASTRSAGGRWYPSCWTSSARFATCG